MSKLEIIGLAIVAATAIGVGRPNGAQSRVGKAEVLRRRLRSQRCDYGETWAVAPVGTGSHPY